ncbi:MAG: hypothetical protein AYP45_03125 [Candidatus Brocadia carolinensis]|uniref:Uncharacterized protein n=1 Tax=Candidatus Brocadia carolinensis TaxID=1004156 RepID=A0A1V4AWK3_9BACT|nr:MAG: hypothetical protein AYP45_03125 [Candidatus Brocadia caroliniensis]
MGNKMRQKMMYWSRKEAVVYQWRMILLLMVATLCTVVVQSGWAHAGMSLEARVACQRLIEEVSWKHTIWPEENTSPKPPLSEVISEEELRKKVTETLRMSKALEIIWKHPVEGYQLQAEMERMAETTQDAETLRELWEALGNDPQLIAEVLARQVLVERLIHDWYAFDERFHGRLKKRALRSREGHDRAEDMKGMGSEYHEVEWKKGKHVGEKGRDNTSENVVELSADEWQEEAGHVAGIFGVNEEEIPIGRVSELQEDEDRFYVLEVIGKGDDGMRMGVMEWKKRDFGTWWSRVGERFVPEVEDEAYTHHLPEIAAAVPLSYASNAMSSSFVKPPPSARRYHTAVWTGTEMIVWGGTNITAHFNTGGRYNPATNTWTSTSTTGAPNTWSATTIGPTPVARSYHTAVWTGTQMIVWGGRNATSRLNTGGRYKPATNTWTRTSTTGAPSGRDRHTAVWTGTTMIVWGGYGSGYLGTGGLYFP